MAKESSAENGSGIAELAGEIKLRRTGFRNAAEPGTGVDVKQSAKARAKEAGSMQTDDKRETSLFERITFHITAEQRSLLTNVATTLHYQRCRTARREKINRDMVMRSVLSIAEKIRWNEAGALATEEDVKRFVLSQVEIRERPET